MGPLTNGRREKMCASLGACAGTTATLLARLGHLWRSPPRPHTRSADVAGFCYDKVRLEYRLDRAGAATAFGRTAQSSVDMFGTRARLRARDRRPYLAFTEDIATADDHGALPIIVKNRRMDDVTLAFQNSIPSETGPPQHRLCLSSYSLGISPYRTDFCFATNCEQS